jgi:hypothetical protein
MSLAHFKKQSQVKEQKQLSRQKNIAAKTLINQLNTGEIE